MKLYEVTNGYIGSSYMRVLVIAKDEERAVELAREKYKKEVDKFSFYNESYYKNLEANCLCENISKEWASEAQD